MMTLSSDDQDIYCPECGRPWSDRMDLIIGVMWLVALGLASVALVLVIVVCAWTLW